jgi:hypothetical protein
MPGEMIAAAQILAGSGAAGWFVDKLLGPSADALGEQVKAFASDNLKRVFGKASEKSEGKSLNSLPPGFIYQFVQKASFSEDDEFITNAWANLLLQASLDFKPRLSLISDILSQLNAEDARALNWIVPEDLNLEFPAVVPVNVRTSLILQIENRVRAYPQSMDGVQRLFQVLNTEKMYWPSIVTNVHLPYVDEKSKLTQWFGGGRGVSTSHNVLIRQGLIERFDLITTLDSTGPNVEGLMVTGLGLEFIAICRGVKI